MGAEVRLPPIANLVSGHRHPEPALGSDERNDLGRNNLFGTTQRRSITDDACSASLTSRPA
jgi:hypothetical protein